MRVYDALIRLLSLALFGPSKGVNVLTLSWNYLIILDACRCDIFAHYYKKFLDKSNIVGFRCIDSVGSTTMEFLRNAINEDAIREMLRREVILVNANPMIDRILSSKLKETFYKYVPVWKNYWNFKFGTVRPESVYHVALKTFINNPNEKIIIWFLQPHYPPIHEDFYDINLLALNDMNDLVRIRQSISNTDFSSLALFNLLKTLVKHGYLYLGTPSVGEYMHKALPNYVKAYIISLCKALHYVRRLVSILPGKIIVTSDHGEAFGEYLCKLFPIKVYGHISRVRIKSLIEVPYLELENSSNVEEALKKALRELVRLKLSYFKNK